MIAASAERDAWTLSMVAGVLDAFPRTIIEDGPATLTGNDAR
ncbi:MULTISPECIES: hypothetical protein [unclassified Pseudofrankia]|nr:MULTISPECIES: hypothetical protein [unclassified Pseudofrankia]MDT3440181.1 hypothetical protein [Pseudofrankia sp. BMG5.37]